MCQRVDTDVLVGDRFCVKRQRVVTLDRGRPGVTRHKGWCSVKRNAMVVLLGCLLLPAFSTAAQAQQTEPILFEVLDVHVTPGMTDEYEQAVLEGVAFREEHDYPFPVTVSQASPTHFRFLIRLENWDGRARSDAWFQEHASTPPPFVSRLFGSTDHGSSSIVRVRPDLFYVPEEPQANFAERGSLHEIRLYIEPGSVRDSLDAMRAFIPMYESHEVGTPRLGWQQVIGSDGPMVSVFFPAQSSADFYTTRNADTARMNPEFSDLYAEELAPTVRKREQFDWVPRRDLDYEP